jgi:hypothetical protein
MTDDFDLPIDGLAVELVSKARGLAGNLNLAVQQVGQSSSTSGEQVDLVRSQLPGSAGLPRDQGSAKLFLGERYGDAIRGKRPRRLI